jgi:hypothetical protein
MKRAALLITFLALLVVPSIALGAGSSTCQAYHSQLSQLCTKPLLPSPTLQVPGQPPPTPTTPRLMSVSLTKTRTLPFTGLDLGLLVAGGSVLLVAGLVVRRLSSDRIK